MPSSPKQARKISIQDNLTLQPKLSRHREPASENISLRTRKYSSGSLSHMGTMQPLFPGCIEPPRTSWHPLSLPPRSLLGNSKRTKLGEKDLPHILIDNDNYLNFSSLSSGAFALQKPLLPSEGSPYVSSTPVRACQSSKGSQDASGLQLPAPLTTLTGLPTRVPALVIRFLLGSWTGKQ